MARAPEQFRGKAVIDSSYPLEPAAALRQQQSGRHVGEICLSPA
ncbi:hypothetical protein ACFQOZ_20180 [Comamonas endophytica]